jgi:hypothetical protein
VAGRGQAGSSQADPETAEADAATPGGGVGSSKGRRGRENAGARRTRLFRQAMVRGVLLLHGQHAQLGGMHGSVQRTVGLPAAGAGAGHAADASAAAAGNEGLPSGLHRTETEGPDTRAGAGPGPAHAREQQAAVAAAEARRAAAVAAWCPVQHQAWHPSFPLASITLAQVGIGAGCRLQAVGCRM